MRVLGVEPRSSGIAASALNYWAISPSQWLTVLILLYLSFLVPLSGSWQNCGFGLRCGILSWKAWMGPLPTAHFPLGCVCTLVFFLHSLFSPKGVICDTQMINMEDQQCAGCGGTHLEFSSGSWITKANRAHIINLDFAEKLLSQNFVEEMIPTQFSTKHHPRSILSWFQLVRHF